MRTEDLLKDLPDVRVGIGKGSDNGRSQRSASAFRNAEVYDSAEELAEDLRSGSIEAAVRGDMPSSRILPTLKDVFRLEELRRAVLLEPSGRRLVFVAPVGIDEGWTVRQKYELAVGCVDLMRRIGMGERIAVMSGGREDDRGRSREVDRTLDQASELVGILSREGYDPYHSQILIESAVDDADLIIAPDGISGNLIFRTLHFLGGAKALGAPVINMEKVFVDTSRAKTDYRDSIGLAMRLTEG